ncbi:hypothetical protein CDD82_3489 [Ophiocordyceps australis]|uniref:Uncharacterized protein n=1 Tax=Ophiocordyceps australis TaxID=1399860 RepID=A0A2C5Z8W5_9HYPO|nr:hypothetical protein CDD82_3489 [Ophiocordyceps australis]
MDKNKGKAKEETCVEETQLSLSQRLNASGRMVLNALTASDSSALSGMSPEPKATSSTVAQDNASTAYSVALLRAPVVPKDTGKTVRSGAQAGSSIREEFNVFIDSMPLPTSIVPNYLHGQEPPDRQSAVAQQEAADGSDVAQLLSVCDDDVLPEMWQQHGEELWTAEAKRLHYTLFHPSPHGLGRSYDWDRLLNFTPDFMTPRAREDSSLDAQLHFGTSDVAVAQDIWLQQWSSVLSAYTDEVWGELGPLAEEARRELDDGLVGAAGPGKGSMALARLQQILAHVREGGPTSDDVIGGGEGGNCQSQNAAAIVNHGPGLEF